MRFCLAIVFFASTTFQLVIACSCAGTSFCDVQYNITKIYHGEVITPNSELYTGEEYENTDSTVWIISGNSSICMPDISDQTAILAVSYNNHNAFGGPPNEFGYAPHACQINYFPVASNNTISGWIMEFNQIDTLTIAEFEQTIESGCSASISSIVDHFSESTTLYPQPSTGAIIIEADFELQDWKLRLFDMSGKEIKVVQAENIDISELERGVYFLHFIKDRQRFTKKIIKI